MMKESTLRFLPLFLFSTTCLGQIAEYDDYLGGGHSQGIAVFTSHSATRAGWDRAATGTRTLDGGGLDGNRMAASRFLTQAAFGGSPAQIEGLAHDLNFEKWMETQFSLAPTLMQPLTQEAFQTAKAVRGLDNDVSNYNNSNRHFQMAWWQAAVTRPDVLRQRMALALSEILVISSNSSISDNGSIYASYYDIFMRNGFGNYRDILQEVSLHLAMGVYLTHFRNPKADTTANTFPDENYAREIMQLFTIGLYELNSDGSQKVDGNGYPISTYGYDDIQALASVFTGLGAGALNNRGQSEGRTLGFNTGMGHADYFTPMKMYENQHEKREKTLLGGLYLPANQAGMDDINQALDHLFNHPNVGPFLALRLIQHFVKSNPTPEYVAHVAAAFDHNQDGVRGDLKAVLRAILLHAEARECAWMNEAGQGKLKTPILKYTQFVRSTDKNAPYENYYDDGNGYFGATSYRVLSAPSVFNFYSPEHRPVGPLADQQLVAPEFQIFNAVTSIGFANQVDNWTRSGRLMRPYEFPNPVTVNKDAYFEMAQEPEVLINHLDAYLLHGRMTEQTRSAIRTALSGLPVNNNNQNHLKNRYEIASYLAMISPEYNILK